MVLIYPDEHPHGSLIEKTSMSSSISVEGSGSEKDSTNLRCKPKIPTLLKPTWRGIEVV
jgi:hypothetical protein